MNKLASHESLRLDCVGKSYGIFVTHLAEDNTDSSLRIEGLYDSSHVVLRSAAGPSVIISPMRLALLQDALC